MSIQKKITAIFISLFSFIGMMASLLAATSFASPVAIGNSQTFIVSAYYSPLPNQSTYVWGSYEADKRMNGEGIRGADFTKVYAGMIAAPSSYAFGTKIYIPGFGTGTVHDRGGRINENGNGDRIDLWMGWGDDGRKRALQWGMKTVTGTIKSKNSSDNIQFSFVPAAQQKKYTQTKTPENTKPTLGIGDKSQSVTNLQKFLKKRGYLSVNATGYYGEKTANAVFLFQKEYKIVSSWSDGGAGVFGPKTRTQAEKIWNDPVTIKTFAIEKKEKTIPKESVIVKEKIVEVEKVKTVVSIQKKEKYNPDYAVIKPDLQKGDSGNAVERLQLVLKGMGYFSGNANGVYGATTEDAVFAFQKDRKIVSSRASKGAGRFGPQTYSSMVNELLKKQRKIKNPIASDEDFITKEQLAMRRQKINLALYNVEFGENNNNVIALQEELIARGFLSEGLNTGYYGNQTHSALEAYKKFVG